jgi:hypothetical protein
LQKYFSINLKEVLCARYCSEIGRKEAKAPSGFIQKFLFTKQNFMSDGHDYCGIGQSFKYRAFKNYVRSGKVRFG